MKLAILCLCLVSTACAVPVSIKNPFTAGFQQPGVHGAYSVEIIYPHTFGAAGGANPAQPFPSYGFIKYSIPQPPGRQSVEVVSVLLFFPLRNDCILLFLFQIPTFAANALPSQDPPQPLQQDQPTQTSQVTTSLYVIIKHESALRV
uniref:Secretory calcium-binding phosphoprotein 5 n=1 Tax=Acanthochromis polyacanthus TaxID=80966 RepID=A0A3Q1FF81_9TELE